MLRPCEAPASHTCRGLVAIPGHWVRRRRIAVGKTRIAVGEPFFRAGKESWECLRKPLAQATSVAVEIHPQSRRILVPEKSGSGKARVTATCRRARPGSTGRSSCHRALGGHLGRRAEAPPSHTWGGLSLYVGGPLAASRLPGPW